MKVIGLMVTYNEEHFLPYSLPVLMDLIDILIVLDGSSDNTRNILTAYNNVILYKEEDYPRMNYKERRQFILDRSRELYGNNNIYICTDADELISAELFTDIRNIIDSNPEPCLVRSRWGHPCLDFKHMAYTFNYMDPIQSILFVDSGNNYTGNDLVHENKLPHREDSIIIDSYIIHFGLCNPEYLMSKTRLYLLLEYLENKKERPASYLNLRYFRGITVLKNKEKYSYRYKISDDIFNTDTINEKYNSKLCEVIYNHKNRLDEFYNLDIWTSPEVIKTIQQMVPEFDISKIRFKCRNRIVMRTRLLGIRVIDMIKDGKFNEIILHIWNIIRGNLKTCF